MDLKPEIRKRLRERRVRFWTVQILLVLLIVLVSSKVSFIFIPVVVFVTTLFFPIIIGGFLFFLLNPLVKFLVSKKVPKMAAIGLMFLALLGVLVSLIFLIGKPAMLQLSSLVQQMPRIINNIMNGIIDFSRTPFGESLLSVADINKITESAISYGQDLINGLFDRITSMVSVITNLALIFILVPYILFYMLKDGSGLQKHILKFLPNSFCAEGEKILDETTTTIARYIQGQLTVCSFVGFATMIGYFMIDLEYALLFAIFMGVFNIIPFLGPWIGMTPAVIIGFLDSPTQGMLVIIVVAIVQQIESGVISPLVMRNRLKVYPLTIMLLLIVAGNLAGILGMVLAVPTYAVVKVLVRNFIRIWRLRRKQEE